MRLLGVDWINEVGDSEGQADGVYEKGFTAGSLARIGVRDKTRGQGTKVGSDKELTEVFLV
jgi:hypothetical protein